MAATNTTRFDADGAEFDLTDVSEGDRIDPALVARTLDGLGTARDVHGERVTQLAEATITDGMDDVHTAVLVDGETGLMAVASRHDKQQAWSRKEADWKVRSVGERIDVQGAEVVQDPTDEWAGMDSEEVAQETERWLNVVLRGRADGSEDYSDELALGSRSRLTVSEPFDGVKVNAEVELVEVDDA